MIPLLSSLLRTLDAALARSRASLYDPGTARDVLQRKTSVSVSFTKSFVEDDSHAA